MTRRVALACLLALVAAFAAPAGRAQDQPGPAVAAVPYRPPPAGPRYLALISDLHFGVGRRRDGSWYPTEDFRWPKALAGFLDEISRRGEERVDLVVVGDMLELWQPPPEIACVGRSAELGCTLTEMETLIRLVVAAHADALDALRAFSARGENRLHIVPGNHDATIRYERVWRPLGGALGDGSGRIALLEKGIWVSPDERIVAEHGHQIGHDVNRYATWPRVVEQVDRADYVMRPWGERFVQRLFNEQEEQYPIIDNLSPESAGIKYRKLDRGMLGSAADIARFFSFNLLETSWGQKGAALGKKEDGTPDWDLKLARRLGADLFVNGLKPEDPLRAELEGAEGAALRGELAALAADEMRLPDEQVRSLCDLIAVRAEEKKKRGATDKETKDVLCGTTTLGAAAESLLVAKSWVMQAHLLARRPDFPRMRFFIYAHTHQYEKPWQVALDGRVTVTVANTGAFQRLIDEPGFLRRLQGRTPQEALRTMALDELPPCYTAVLVPPAAGGQPPAPAVMAWQMTEDGTGSFVPPDDAGCR